MFSCLNLRIPLRSVEESLARFMVLIESIAEIRLGLDFSVSVLVLGERILMKTYYILFLIFFFHILSSLVTLHFVYTAIMFVHFF